MEHQNMQGMDHSKMDYGANPPIGHIGHNHYAMMIADFKKRFFVVLILTIPIVLLSPMIQQFLGEDWHFNSSLYDHADDRKSKQSFK